MKGLLFDFSKISFETQVLKIIEELGEVMQDRKGKGDIGEETADLLIAVYGLSEILGIDIEKEKNKVIEKVNKMITNNPLTYETP